MNDRVPQDLDRPVRGCAGHQGGIRPGEGDRLPVVVTYIDHNVSQAPAPDSPGPAPPQPDHTAATSVTLARAARRARGLPDQRRRPPGQPSAPLTRPLRRPCRGSRITRITVGAGSEPGGVWRSAEETQGFPGGPGCPLHGSRGGNPALMFPLRRDGPASGAAWPPAPSPGRGRRGGTNLLHVRRRWGNIRSGSSLAAGATEWRIGRWSRHLNNCSGCTRPCW